MFIYGVNDNTVELKKLECGLGCRYVIQFSHSMFKEASRGFIDKKIHYAHRMYTSRRDRLRVISLYEERVNSAPEKADVALVLGTSLDKYPDKFKKRVFTAVKLVEWGRVNSVIFTGRADHETNDVDQAGDARRIAINEFGLDDSKIATVGGDNTNENLLEAEMHLIDYTDVNDIFLVSNNSHLLRTIYLADYTFKGSAISVHPFPILGHNEVDPDDPRIRMELVKSLLYNRLLNKTPYEPSGETRDKIDNIVNNYAKSSFTTKLRTEVPFEKWKENI